MPARPSRRVPVLLAALILLLAACGDDSAAPAGPPAATPARPVIVATTSILGDVVTRIVGDDAVVEVIMPIGADPHDFQASAQQAALLRDASLVIANGYSLEIGLVRELESAAADGATVIQFGDLIEPIEFGAASHDHGDDDDDHGDDDHGHEDDDHGDDDHGHEDEDPHFWHDPHRMADALPELARLIGDALPELDAEVLSDRADELAAAFDAADAEIAEILSVVPDDRRYLITNHDTFGYLAARYGFEIIGTVIPGGDTLAAPSAGDIADLVEEIRAHDLPAIFADNTVASILSDTLAREAGEEVEVVSLYTDSLGEPGSDADTYLGMLLANARLIADALS